MITDLMFLTLDPDKKNHPGDKPDHSEQVLGREKKPTRVLG